MRARCQGSVFEGSQVALQTLSLSKKASSDGSRWFARDHLSIAGQRTDKRRFADPIRDILQKIARPRGRRIAGGLPPFFFLGCPPLCLIGRSYRFAARCRFFLASENGLVEKESISPVPAGVTRHLIGTSIACFRGRIMRICDRLRAAANWVSSTIEGGGNSKPKDRESMMSASALKPCLRRGFFLSKKKKRARQDPQPLPKRHETARQEISDKRRNTGKGFSTADRPRRARGSQRLRNEIPMGDRWSRLAAHRRIVSRSLFANSA